jgi:hypothetical protein
MTPNPDFYSVSLSDLSDLRAEADAAFSALSDLLADFSDEPEAPDLP